MKFAWGYRYAYLDLAPTVGDRLGLDTQGLGHLVDVKLREKTRVSVVSPVDLGRQIGVGKTQIARSGLTSGGAFMQKIAFSRNCLSVSVRLEDILAVVIE